MVARVLAAGLALLAIAAVVTPTGRYIVRAAWEEGRILWRRRPIEAVAADAATPPAVRAKLQLVLAARRYARDSLGLVPEESFTTFSPLDRDTLVLVLSAARRDTLAQHTWWFPVVGSVPYKGYFDFAAATREAAAMRARGFDTYVRPASAFSTLGWFNDPLLSTTLRLDTLDLANTVIHELTHNTLFVRGAVAFNESFASFVGARGAARFFRGRGAPRAAERVDREWNDEKQLAAFWGAVSRAADSAFAAHPGDSLARVQAGDSVYRRMRRVLLDDLSPKMPTIPRAALQRMALDNAALLARRVYASDLWLFDEVYRRSGGDVRQTIAVVRQVVRNTDDPFGALRRWLSAPSIAAASSGRVDMSQDIGDLRTGAARGLP